MNQNVGMFSSMRGAEGENKASDTAVLSFSFDNLSMPLGAIDSLKKMKEWRIYDEKSFDLSCKENSSSLDRSANFPLIDFQIDQNQAKDLIKTLDVQSSFLHFQVFLVNENQKIFPTGIMCKTEMIRQLTREHSILIVMQEDMSSISGKEARGLPEHMHCSKPKQNKRLQSSSKPDKTQRRKKRA